MAKKETQKETPEPTLEELQEIRKDTSSKIRELKNAHTFNTIYRNVRKKEVSIMRDKSLKGEEKKTALRNLFVEVIDYIDSADKEDEKDAE